jgi:transcriptional regulator with XRE-family HTH domain
MMLFMEWKDILRELLDKHGITAAELSRRSKVSPSDISRYLSGERTEPAFSVVLKIANALGEPMPGGTRTIEQGMIAARIQRDPEVEDFVREWQNLPDEAREVTRELVRILGHSDIRVTANIYGHVYDFRMRQAANLMDDVLGDRDRREK